jgi:hypothetical protein
VFLFVCLFVVPFSTMMHIQQMVVHFVGGGEFTGFNKVFSTA